MQEEGVGQEMLWVDVVVRHDPAPPWAVAGLVVASRRRRGRRMLSFIVSFAYQVADNSSGEQSSFLQIRRRPPSSLFFG